MNKSQTTPDGTFEQTLCPVFSTCPSKVDIAVSFNNLKIISLIYNYDDQNIVTDIKNVFMLR